MFMDNGHGLILPDKRGRPIAAMNFITERIVRINIAIDGRFGQAGFADDILTPPYENVKQQDIRGLSPDGSSYVEHSGFKVELDENGRFLSFFHKSDQAFLKQDLSGADGRRLEFHIKEGEGFYGFGEWFNGFRRESGELLLYNKESPAFLQHKQTYSAFPCFLSDRGYMVAVLNGHRGRVNINKSPGILSLDFSGGFLDYLVVYGPSFKKILEEYTGLTGRPPLLPIWSFGLWNTSYPVENQEETMNRVKKHRDKAFPLDAVILDYHWEEGFHNFKWRKNIFPDPDQMIKELKENGVKLGLIYTPYINQKVFSLYKHLVRLYVKNAPAGVPFFSHDSADDIYNEGLQRGFLAHPKITWWLGRGGAVDFTNPEAVDWWFEFQKPLLDQGVYFFKNDGGEYLPEKGSKSALGLDPEEYHNVYGFYYAKALFEKLTDYHQGRRPLIFSRTTWIGTQRYPAVFLGDQTPEFKHIQATMRCGLNMSLQGFAYWGADVLSLYRRPNEELHMRYSQWALLCPIARYFSAPGEDARDPWGISDICAESFKRHLELRMSLLPYYYRLAFEAHEFGLPIVRPLILEFQDDEQVKYNWRQAMIGEAIMIAPVLTAGAKEQSVYFPKGTWFSYWDGTEYQGPAMHVIKLKPDYLPVFIRGGHPLTLGPVCQYIPEDHRFTELEIHLYPPYTSGSYIYEDDGLTLEYKDKARAFQRILFSMNNEAGTLSILMEAAKGSFNGRPVDRKVVFVIHKAPEIEEITFDSAAGVDEEINWQYDKAGQRLFISGMFPTEMENKIEIIFK